MFNNIHIKRNDEDGNITHFIKVPLAYAPKEKVLVRPIEDPNIDRPSAITLPRMSFELKNMVYDGQRKVGTLQKYSAKHTTDPNKAKLLYAPVPYNLEFVLYIYVKNTADGLKILEQIVPFFTPDWTATIHLIPAMSVTIDIPVVLNSVSLAEEYEGDFKDRKILYWTLNFTLKGYYYGPTYNKPIIKYSNTNFYVPVGDTEAGNGQINSSSVGNTDMIGSIQVRPGLDANGDPTSNASLSVNTNIIEIDDDFGYIIEDQGIILVE